MSDQHTQGPENPPDSPIGGSPSTEAGKRLLELTDGRGEDLIAAIEAEARQQAEARVAEKPADAIDCPLCGGYGYLVDQTELVESTLREGHRLRAIVKEPDLTPLQEEYRRGYIDGERNASALLTDPATSTPPEEPA